MFKSLVRVNKMTMRQCSFHHILYETFLPNTLKDMSITKFSTHKGRLALRFTIKSLNISIACRYISKL